MKMAAEQQMTCDEGFVFPKRKGRNRNRNAKSCSSSSLYRPVDEAVGIFSHKILDCLHEIEDSQFYKDFKESWFRCLRLSQMTKDECSSLVNSTQDCSVHSDSCKEQTDVNIDDHGNVSPVDACITDQAFIKGCPDVTHTDKPNGQDPLGTNTEDGSSNIEEIVCYGLGNFSSCIIARYQMAFLMALRDTLQIEASSCFLFDPQFSSLECQYIYDHGMKVLMENEEGKRKCNRKTVYYMPHCGKPLYNNLLWANWTPELLQNCIILGNSFSTTVQSLPSKALQAQAHYIQMISPYTLEQPVQNNFRFTDIFNDTSVHCFPRNKLMDIDSDFWKDNTEPMYDQNNLEIILNKMH